MNPEELQAIVAQGETFSLEFKRAKPLNALSDNDIVEAVVCLANGDGGQLLLGVENDGTITGAAPRHQGATDPYRLQAMILNKTESPVATSIEVVRHSGLDVVVIDVPAPAMPVGTKSGKYVRRALKADGAPECVPYPLHEMLSVGLSAQERDYAATPARGSTMNDLDPVEFERFRQLCASGRGDATLAESSDLDILRALRLVLPDQGNQLTLGAILIFGTHDAIARYVPTAEVTFQELRDGEILANEVLRQPLLRTAERLYELVEVRNSEQELILGLHRIGVPRVPPGAIRESIANALVHRDYSELGPISVQLSEAHFRVKSPGGFPPGITMANLLDDSRPRSPILADAFKRAGIVDRAGRGVQEMYRLLLRAGRGVPDYGATNDHAVILTLPTSDADIDMVRFVLEYEEAASPGLTLVQLRILHELKAMGPQTLAELVSGLKLVEASLRPQLARLAELGLVEPRGPGRNRRHHLTAAFYRSAQSSEYVRIQDTDPIQQEHMVLAYVDQFGTITRSKAAELCRLSPPQARGVLRRLVSAGELQLVGERRAARYIRASTSAEDRLS